MRDFFSVLNEFGLYDENNHNKSTHEYTLQGNLIEFIGIDQSQRVRGRKRDILWCNETNELEYDDFFQLNIRTAEEVYCDYNPSDEYHWIYEKILPRKDCQFRKFTIFDNPYAPEGIKSEILALKDQDENLWKIYGLGERGQAKDLIFTNWDIQPFPRVCNYYRYGLDFGYNHPSVILFVGVKEKDIYVDEILYQTHLTNQDLINKMLSENIEKNVLIRADSAEPDRIKEISYAGFAVEGAKKSSYSVKDGIDTLKRCQIHITAGSINVLKEIKNYRWKKDKKTSRILDEPIPFRDDGMDAMRYAVGDLLLDNGLFQIKAVQKFSYKPEPELDWMLA